MRPEVDRLLEEIAGGARLGADQRPVAAEQAVEQAALARIGRAENDGFHPGAEHLTIMARGQKAGGGLGEFFELASGEISVLGRQIFLGEIDLGLDAREEAEQRVDKFLQVPAERTAELLV